MQEAVAGLGAALRPHFKTHRTRAGRAHAARGRRDRAHGGNRAPAGDGQRASSAARCSSRACCRSIPRSARRCARRAPAGGVLFAVESPRSVELLRAALGPEPRADVMIEIEAGCRRSGVAPSECAALARLAAQAGVRGRGRVQLPGPLLRPRAAARGRRAGADRAERGGRRAGARRVRAAARQRRLDADDALRARRAWRPSTGPARTCSATASSSRSARSVAHSSR